ncbi:hypothetical protein VCHE16_0643 [Vibrio paracholerae HE-16]|nr:hypothetical protein VCHE16_0643 [Vibrio paracholerae HE-16]
MWQLKILLVKTSVSSVTPLLRFPEELLSGQNYFQGAR